jgi:rare lipoprotein A
VNSQIEVAPPTPKIMYDASIMPLSVVALRVSSGFVVRACLTTLLLACLSACGSSGGKGGGGSVAQRGIYKVGNPYKIDGVTYVPREEFDRIETGVASWYGPGFHGKSTANGEEYDQRDRTAAHRTLQMPSIVRVTNLENGLSTVVRINDRGPFARSRVIDLSRQAAEELDIVRNGTARVRIEQLRAESLAVREVAMGGGGPAEQHQALAQLASGRRGAPAAPAAPPKTEVAVVQPPPPAPAPAPPPAQPQYQLQPQPQMVWTTSGSPTVASLASTAHASTAYTSSGGYYVQVGAFSSPENAERQRGAVRSYGSPEISQASSGGREVYRVRLGPYTTADAAGIVADRLKRSGYGDARVVAD